MFVCVFLGRALGEKRSMTDRPSVPAWVELQSYLRALSASLSACIWCRKHFCPAHFKRLLCSPCPLQFKGPEFTHAEMERWFWVWRRDLGLRLKAIECMCCGCRFLCWRSNERERALVLTWFITLLLFSPAHHVANLLPKPTLGIRLTHMGFLFLPQNMIFIYFSFHSLHLWGLIAWINKSINQIIILLGTVFLNVTATSILIGNPKIHAETRLNVFFVFEMKCRHFTLASSSSLMNDLESNVVKLYSWKRLNNDSGTHQSLHPHFR